MSVVIGGKNQTLLDMHKIRESGAENPPDNIESVEWSGWRQCENCGRWWQREELLNAHKIENAYYINRQYSIEC